MTVEQTAPEEAKPVVAQEANVGNKLLKYDNKLNLVKEVEIKVECPMTGKMAMMGMKGKMKKLDAQKEELAEAK